MHLSSPLRTSGSTICLCIYSFLNSHQALAGCLIGSSNFNNESKARYWAVLLCIKTDGYTNQSHQQLGNMDQALIIRISGLLLPDQLLSDMTNNTSESHQTTEDRLLLNGSTSSGLGSEEQSTMGSARQGEEGQVRSRPSSFDFFGSLLGKPSMRASFHFSSGI